MVEDGRREGVGDVVAREGIGGREGMVERGLKVVYELERPGGGRGGKKMVILNQESE